MLDKTDIVMYHKAGRELEEYTGRINGRISHILNEVFPKAVNDFKMSWWDWPGGDKYHDGHIDYGFSGESVSIECEWPTLDDSAAQDVLSDIVYDGLYEMLFMSDDEIVDDLKESIRSTKDKRAKAKKKRQEGKARKDQIKQAALEKLSAEERKALGVK